MSMFPGVGRTGNAPAQALFGARLPRVMKDSAESIVQKNSPVSRNFSRETGL